MIVTREFTKTLAIFSDPLEAAVNKQTTARTILSDLSHRCCDGVLVLEILDITYTGPILNIPDTQACTQAAMVVTFTVKGCVLGRGDALLMLVQAANSETGMSQFSNSLCIGIPADDRITLAYQEGQLVPMQIIDSQAHAGNAQFLAEVVPWTLKGESAPLIVRIELLSPTSITFITRESQVLDKTRTSIPQSEAIYKLFGIKDSPKDGLSFVEALTKFSKYKTLMLGLNVGHGTLSVYEIPDTLSKVELDAAIPLETALMLLLLRESGFISMVAEIDELHMDKINSENQKAVWAIVTQAIPITSTLV